MPDRNIFAERERGLEDEYFHKQEVMLIEKIRERMAMVEELRKMSAGEGEVDEEVVEALQDLGYRDTTIRLLHLVPLVQIAWAEDGVSLDERKAILDIAATRGVTPDTEAQAQLLKWLDQRPDESFFKDSLRAIRILLEALPADQRDATRHDLVEYCTQIARVSGGFLGFHKISATERHHLEEIARMIGSNREETVRRVLGS